MKKTALIFGTILTLIGFFQFIRYLTDYNILTSYGKGYVWGSAILLIFGIGLLLVGLIKSKKRNK